MRKLVLLALAVGLSGCSQVWKIEKKPYQSQAWGNAKVTDMGRRPSIEDASKAICHGKDQEPQDRIRYTNQSTGEVLEYSCQEIYKYRLDKVNAEDEAKHHSSFIR